ncbi:hypothetical protein [Riemerella columbipharyngis]|uniref:Glycosyltransferase RgtA/B/C/D-like domain-containing protein n=1 Tax=Riemerella columbipharyngis TaxID=1071918 RepID=A0A1G7BC61_9FLAO|nr:hypothetical protein [Riemerella columbipharyngis]SDE24400.1 hypothetical protein SAMN05421544_105103 [Riemerella columbipharyngis]
MGENNIDARLPIIFVALTVLLKLPFLLTHHIQEDAFITWRVAQNLLDYGVAGFNGPIKISASTTHLYMFVSFLFNVIFGKANFIYPLLVFNSTLFTIGSYFLSRMILKKPVHQALFILLFGFLPPAIRVSILGMEYGLLFFLEMGFLYYAFFRNKTWAVWIFPVLILFTRLDTVIFLGIIFIVDTVWNKKIRWNYVVSGALGLGLLISFNWFYFGELVNNTIVAKKLAYYRGYGFGERIALFFRNFGNFFGMLKMPGNFNPYTILVLLFEIACFYALVRQKDKRNFFLIIIFAFAWIKQSIFLYELSYFDWYYWVPQLLLFASVIVFILEQEKRKYLWGALFLLFYVLPMLLFQMVHSIATGNGEWNYRREIGLFLGKYEKDKNQWIFLEPAGFVPYYSGLRTIDEVGLVDKGVQQEMIKDKKDYWFNTVKDRKPKYILVYRDLYQDPKHAEYYQEHYKLIKEFRVKDHLSSPYKIIETIYKLKPSGSDYNLYQKVK